MNKLFSCFELVHKVKNVLKMCRLQAEDSIFKTAIQKNSKII